MFKMEKETENPKPGEKYRHFKGKDKVYEIIAIARDCDNPDRKDVVYKSLYDGKFPFGTIWRRSLEEFVGFKELNGEKIKRFIKIE
jgi:hypothetical protein